MDPLLAARLQMALSLGFHMVFAALGVGLPLLMWIAEGLWLRTRKPHYLELARTWAKATGVLFAIGAVSGTALSFELGLLWPHFMAFAGTAIGPAFTTEAFAFFLEAIFIALYLYGWERLSPRAHWWTGLPVAISGAASSVLVVAANAWMQNPLGADLLRIASERLDPVAILFGNPAWGVMAVHSTLAAYATTGFGVAGIYAWGALRGRRTPLGQGALRIALVVGSVAVIALVITGDWSARWVAEAQPVKLAAMEAQFRTERGAPLRIGGWPDPERRQVPYAIEIPRGLSQLAYGDPEAEVAGLADFPRDEWPDVRITHIAFQVMVGSAFLLLALALWYWLAAWRRRGGEVEARGLMRSLVAASPLGLLALEAGWVVTEVGRQPWILYGVMRIEEAVTPAPGVTATLVGFTALYLLLTFALIGLLLPLRHERAAARGREGGRGRRAG